MELPPGLQGSDEQYLLRAVQVPQYGPYVPEVAANPMRGYYNSK